MTLIFNNEETYNYTNIQEKGKTESTVLIPRWMLKKFKDKVKTFGSLNRYFKYIMLQYRQFSYTGNFPGARTAKTEFQDKGLELTRFNFTPENKDWIELTLLAQATGKSKTLYFVMLVTLDLDGIGKLHRSLGIMPGTPRLATYQLKIQCDLKRITANYGRRISFEYAGIRSG